MLPLEGNEEEEEKELKGLKILTPIKLLTRLPVLLAQIKARKIWYNVKKWNQTNTLYVWTQ